MTIKTPFTEYVPIGSGRYSSKITNVEYDNSGLYGSQYRWEFEQLEHDNRTLVAWASAKISLRSKLFKWAKNLLDESSLRENVFDPTEYVGMTVTVDVVESENEKGEVYDRVENIKRDFLPI